MSQDSQGPGVPPPLPGAAEAASTPWERRARLGLVTALLETSKEVIAAPTAFYRRMPVTGGIGAPLGYGVIVGYIGVFAKAIYDAVFRAVLGSSLSGFGSRPELRQFAAFLESGVGLVVQIILGPLFVLIGIFIAAGIFHILLMLLGGARRDFEATLRVVSYSEAASLFAIIPMCGTLVGVVYQIVLWIIGLAEAHGISKGMAAAAVLIPLVLVCCCCLAVILTLAGGLAAVLGQMR